MAKSQRQAGCPCCGAPMAVVSETETRVSLKCPACSVSDVRIK